MPVVRNSLQTIQTLQQGSRTAQKRSRQQNEQYQTQNTEEFLRMLAQLVTHNLRKRSTSFANREHSAQVVMYTTGEDSTEYNP